MFLFLNGKPYIGNGSINEFSSNSLLTEDLIAIKYMRYLVFHIFTPSIDFNDINIGEILKFLSFYIV